MNFKNDFLAALRAGQDHQALMELVLRHRTEGLSVNAAYEALHEIWAEHDFGTKMAEEGTLQDTLETVMEKVWYGQPVL